MRVIVASGWVAGICRRCRQAGWSSRGQLGLECASDATAPCAFCIVATCWPDSSAPWLPNNPRRALIPMHPDLKFAGVLPPLDAPHHLRSTEWGPYREGVVRSSDPATGSFIDVGLEKVSVRGGQGWVAVAVGQTRACSCAVSGARGCLCRSRSTRVVHFAAALLLRWRCLALLVLLAPASSSCVYPVAPPQDAWVEQAVRPSVRVTLAMGAKPTTHVVGGKEVLVGRLALPSGGCCRPCRWCWLRLCSPLLSLHWLASPRLAAFHPARRQRARLRRAVLQSRATRPGSTGATPRG